MIEGFSVFRRNFGHWDVSAKGNRLFRIRGKPGDYVVLDERERHSTNIQLKTVTACMTYICEILMYENLQLEGAPPVIVDSGGNPVQNNGG